MQPASPASLLEYARRLASQGRWPEVRECLASLATVGDAPQDRDTGLLLAQSEFATGAVETARTRLEDLIRSHPEDAPLHYEAAAMALDAGHFDAAEAHAASCIRLSPNHFGAWLVAGFARAGLGERDRSLGALLRAIRLAERADPRRLPPAIRQGLSEASRRVRQRLAEVLDASLDPVAREYGEADVARLRKGAAIFAGFAPPSFAHPLWRPGLFYIPDLPVRMFFEREEFDWHALAEAAYPAIRGELLACLEDAEAAGFSPYVDHAEGTHEAQVWAEVNRSRRWSSLHFFRHGEPRPAAHARCPATSAMLAAVDLQRIPGYGPEAMFSVLQPGARIPPHYGSVNGRLIVHLPLVVPPDCGGLRVGTETRGWEEGRLLIFDDSFQHEAWNHSDAVRTVLIFDTWNPALSPGEREATRAVLIAVQGFEAALLGEAGVPG
ncbi:MAG: hypothetical protein KatS3mg127_0239 [Silanimonas sp.]|nr:MAG: hypothetical protein KatS3mg127_0239 [Silanimonas sp.]